MGNSKELGYLPVRFSHSLHTLAKIFSNWQNFNHDSWNTSKPWVFGLVRFSYVIAKNQHILDFSSFAFIDSPNFHISYFLAPATKAFCKNVREMTQEKAPALTPDALGDDNGVALAEKYRVENLVERRVGRSYCPISATMMLAAQPINQVAPDHWHTKVDKCTLTVKDLEDIYTKYQIPMEVELRLPMAKEWASDAGSMEFTLYEEALNGGLRLPLLQIAIDVLNCLELALGQLVPNAI